MDKPFEKLKIDDVEYALGFNPDTYPGESDKIARFQKTLKYLINEDFLPRIKMMMEV